MNRMKQLLFAALVLLCISPGLSAQNPICTGSVLSDDFSNPALWSALGTPTSGTIAVTGGATVYDDFMGRQSYRLVRQMNGALVNDMIFRMEFESIITEDDNLSGAMLMAITSNNSHPRTATGGSYTETNNNTIEVLLANPLGTNFPGGDEIKLSSKLGTTRGPTCSSIPIDRNVLYYYRVERTRPGTVVLSVFDDPGRTSHIPGSPICCTIDPNITGLDFLQQGVWTTSSQWRSMTGYTDNLCIYDNVISEDCDVKCLLYPSLSVVDNGNCTYTFTNNTTVGPGTTLFPYNRLDFGDGTWTQLPPGASITHTYPGPGNYWSSLTVRAYDADYRCCEDRVYEPVEVRCEGDLGGGKAAAGGENVLEIFPNPSSGIVHVRSTEQLGPIRIFDTAGRMVKEIQAEGSSLELDMSSFEKGLYILEMEVRGKKVKHKVSLM